MAEGPPGPKGPGQRMEAGSLPCPHSTLLKCHSVRCQVGKKESKILAASPSQQLDHYGAIIFHILQMWKLSLREVKLFATLTWVLWASLMAQMVKNLSAMQETWVRSLGREDPLEKGMATHCSILVWRIPWTEEPEFLCIYGVAKTRTWLSD